MTAAVIVRAVADRRSTVIVITVSFIVVKNIDFEIKKTLKKCALYFKNIENIKPTT